MTEYKIKNTQTNQVEAVVMAHSVSGSAPAFTLFDARGFAVGSFRLQSGFELDIRSAPVADSTKPRPSNFGDTIQFYDMAFIENASGATTVAPEPALPAVEAPEEQV